MAEQDKCPNCGKHDVHLVITSSLAFGVGGIAHCGCFWLGEGRDHIGNTDLPTVDELHEQEFGPSEKTPTHTVTITIDQGVTDEQLQGFIDALRAAVEKRGGTVGSITTEGAK